MTNKPLTREEVLAVLDAYRLNMGYPSDLHDVRAAVEAVYAELDAARKDAERLRKSIETAKIVMQCARDLSEEIHERGSHELHGRLFSAFCKYDSLFEDRQGLQP